MDRDAGTYEDHLAKLPFVRRAKVELPAASDRDVDGLVLLTTLGGKKVRLPLDIKRTHLTREMAERIVHVGRDNPGLLVMAPAIGRELGDFFARERVNFVDLAGNCFVQIEDRYVARIQGQRHEERAPEERALRAPAYRVLFALLADPKLLEATVRTLAIAAGGVSPQTANDVRRRLIARGIVLKTRAATQWTPGQRKQALDMLLLGFAHLMPTLVIGRYRAKQRTTDELELDLAPRLEAIGRWRWGGGAAAYRLTGYYRGEKTIIYVDEADVGAIRALPLVADPTGEITFVRSPGPCAFEGPRPDAVHPLLVYLDLLAEVHDRAREAAAEVHHRYLEKESS